MPEFQINYLAVGVAALATIFIGALWYSPLMFHKLWVKAHGWASYSQRGSERANAKLAYARRIAGMTVSTLTITSRV